MKIYNINILFQCKTIVDEYYREIYDYLINGLNSNGVCEMAGICPSPGKAVYVSYGFTDNKLSRQ